MIFIYIYRGFPKKGRPFQVQISHNLCCIKLTTPNDVQKHNVCLHMDDPPVYFLFCKSVTKSRCQIWHPPTRVIFIVLSYIKNVLSDRSNFNAHTDPIFKELRKMKFYHICSMQMGQFIFSYKLGLQFLARFDSFLILN